MKSTLERLPGIVKDRYDNLKVRGVSSEMGLRHRYSFALRLPFQTLQGVRLDELLEWMQWGSQTGVMWEFTMEELLRVVKWWERANLNASADLYGPLAEKQKMAWDEFWDSHKAIAYMASPITRCRCGKMFSREKELYCPRCEAFYQDGEQIPKHLTRGIGHYNLAIEDASGTAVAALMFETRTWLRPIPNSLPIVSYGGMEW